MLDMDFGALLGVHPAGVDPGVPFRCPDHRLGQDQQRRDLDAFEVTGLLQPLRELHRPGGVDVDEDTRMRGGGRGFHHGLGGGLADPSHRFAGHPLRGGSTGWTVGGQVLAGDLPLPSGATNLGEVDTHILGDLPHRRLGEHPILDLGFLRLSRCCRGRGFRYLGCRLCRGGARTAAGAPPNRIRLRARSHQRAGGLLVCGLFGRLFSGVLHR